MRCNLKCYCITFYELLFHLPNVQYFAWLYQLNEWISEYSFSIVCLFEICICSFLKEFIYLFLDRGERREKERERNCLLYTSDAADDIGQV